MTQAIAAAVEQQRATTEEITRNLTQASAGTDMVSSAVGAVQQTAERTHGSAGAVADSASALIDEMEPLKQRTASRSAEHTSELQSLMRISYAVFCLKKKRGHTHRITHSDSRLAERMHHVTKSS